MAFAESRIRRETIAAEGHPARHRRVLDDVVRLAGHGPGRRGGDPHLADRAQDEAAARLALPRRSGGGGAGRGGRAEGTANDNFRVKRYIAKYTINPALTHGIAHEVGSIEAGQSWGRPGAVAPGLLRRQAEPG